MKRIYKSGIGCLLLGLLVIAQAGCKKLVEPDTAKEKIDYKAVYSNDKTAASVLTRLMAEMFWVSEGTNGIPMLVALSADDIKIGASISLGIQNIYYNGLKDDPSIWWSKFYSYIYTANDALEQLPVSGGVTPKARNSMMGEAYFVRAYCYFYLVNIYGGVPLVLTTDPTVTTDLGRADEAAVYNQIVSDLKEAKNLLSDVYLHSNLLPTVLGDRFRPIKATAAALLARTYLYRGEYAKAEAEATEVINNPLFGFIDLNNVFLKGSKETLWQLPIMQPSVQTLDGMAYILKKVNPTDFNGPTTTNPYLASDWLMNAFETGDTRQTKWIGDSAGYKFINKYKDWDGSKPVREAVMMMRLGEQYLIRAEARIKQNHIEDGVADLNALRTRARGSNPGDLPDLPTGLSPEDAEKAVAHERQIKLFTEWGHRWFDLKRTGKINDVMTVITPLKSTNTTAWDDFRALFPIPSGEILNSPGLRGHQNTGY